MQNSTTGILKYSDYHRVIELKTQLLMDNNKEALKMFPCIGNRATEVQSS